MNDGIKNKVAPLLCDKVQGKPIYCLDGARHKGGASLFLALAWNMGTGRPDDKGEIQVEDPRG
jgi:hypothetical protein